MNNLEKELIKLADNAQKEGESIVSEAKLLLAENANEERAALRSIGLDAEIKMVEGKRQDLILRKNGRNHLGKVILTKDEILSFCTDYRLYMKSARQYMGTVPPDLGAELSRFCKEKNIAMPASSEYSKFFIIAPPKMFKGYLSPWQVVGRAMDLAEERRQERIRRRNEDPILVYELPESPGYFAVIKSWGNDFTPLRKVYGFFTRRSTMRFFIPALNLLVAYLLYSVGRIQFNFFYKWALEQNKNVGPVIIFGFLIALGLVIFYLFWLGHEDFQNLKRDIKEKVIEFERSF